MEKEIKPISPEEIGNEKIKTIPVAMIRAINELIAITWNGNSATIRKDELIQRYCYIRDVPNDRLEIEHLEYIKAFDFKLAYSEIGWKVEYNAPDYKQGFNNDFEPTWKFEKK